MINKDFLLDIVKMQIEETERLDKLGQIKDFDADDIHDAHDIHKQEVHGQNCIVVLITKIIDKYLDSHK